MPCRVGEGTRARAPEPVDRGVGREVGSKEWQGVPDAPRPQVWGSGGLQGLRCRGVGGRGTDGANFATCVVFLKDSLWGGGGYKGARRGVQGLWFRGGRW